MVALNDGAQSYVTIRPSQTEKVLRWNERDGLTINVTLTIQASIAVGVSSAESFLSAIVEWQDGAAGGFRIIYDVRRGAVFRLRAHSITVSVAADGPSVAAQNTFNVASAIHRSDSGATELRRTHRFSLEKFPELGSYGPWTPIPDFAVSVRAISADRNVANAAIHFAGSDIPPVVIIAEDIVTVLDSIDLPDGAYFYRLQNLAIRPNVYSAVFRLQT